jgi:hypothetical protein
MEAQISDTFDATESTGPRADVSRSLEPLLNPFVILVDSAEQHPFDFQGIFADSDRRNRMLRITPGVNLHQQSLGRHPNSLGDYGIEGYIGRCHVERKSQDDAYGTILTWPKADRLSRRQRFEKELANLANCEAALVVVECSLGQLLDQTPDTDCKTAACNRKILARSINAYLQDYPVNWLFCDSRRMAEIQTFRFLERFYEKHRPKRSRSIRQKKESLP